MKATETWLPWLALLATILIWASYLVVVRAAMVGSLSANDVGLLRTVPAALAFLPLTMKSGLKPEGATWIDVALIGLVGGGAFIVFLAWGLSLAPTADGGIFTPTMLPVFVAILSVLFIGTRYANYQLLGLILIIVGAGIFGGLSSVTNAADGVWRGHLLFLFASMSWAIYTVRFRHSGLSPTSGAAIMATSPALVFVACAFFLGTELHQLPLPVLVLQVTQGIAAGLIANFTFFYAIRALGPSIPAASAALVPALAALGAWIFLGEPIALIQLLGMTVAASGVVLASGLVARP